MKSFKKVLSTERRQFKVLAFIAAGIFGLTLVLSFWDPLVFQRFIGMVSPLLVFPLTLFLGGILFYFLVSKTRFSFYKSGNPNNLPYLFGLVFLFALISILVDLKVNFPKEINILFPKSLLFYPVIAFLVEVVFHLLPLSILLFLSGSVFNRINSERVIRVCIFIVATLEPIYQVVFMESFPWWAVIVVWVNLFFFNLTQLYIFKRYDFISMYLFRVFYYAVWHIIWGYVRLDLLF